MLVELNASCTKTRYFPMQSEALGYFADSQKKPDIREAFSMGPIDGARSERLQLAYAASSDDEFYRRVIDFCYQPTPWPEDAAGARLKEAMGRYYEAANRLAEELLRIFARADSFRKSRSTGVVLSKIRISNSELAVLAPDSELLAPN